MLELKLRYLGHLMQRANSLGKTLMLGLKAGGEGGDKGWDDWMASLTEQTLGVGDGQGSLACCSPWGHKELDMTEQLNNNNKWDGIAMLLLLLLSRFSRVWLCATPLPRPLDSPGKNTGVGCHFLLQCMKVKVKSLSRAWHLATPWTAAYQAPPSMGFSRQEYWSGVPLPSPLNSYNNCLLKLSYCKAILKILSPCKPV